MIISMSSILNFSGNIPTVPALPVFLLLLGTGFLSYKCLPLKYKSSDVPLAFSLFHSLVMLSFEMAISEVQIPLLSNFQDIHKVFNEYEFSGV